MLDYLNKTQTLIKEKISPFRNIVFYFLKRKRKTNKTHPNPWGPNSTNFPPPPPPQKKKKKQKLEINKYKIKRKEDESIKSKEKHGPDRR